MRLTANGATFYKLSFQDDVVHAAVISTRTKKWEDMNLHEWMCYALFLGVGEASPPLT